MSTAAAEESAATTRAALDCVAAWRPDIAVIFGSGLAALPENTKAERRVGYSDLGWPCTAVEGHANELVLARSASSAEHELRIALAFGRPHRYEGWTDVELGRPVRDLAAAGTRHFVLLNACGALLPELTGAVVVCASVVDLQRPPERAEPQRLHVCDEAEAAAVAATLLRAAPGALHVSRGTYVAVSGPQFETPAEAAWLAGYGDVVGMSAAPEVHAVIAAGAQCLLLAVVANVAGGADSHSAVLAATGRATAALARVLLPAALARWPELVDSRVQ